MGIFVRWHPQTSWQTNPQPHLTWPSPPAQGSLLTGQHVGADQQVRQELLAFGGQAASQGPRLQARQDLREKLPKGSRVPRGRAQEAGVWSWGAQPHRRLESGWPLDLLFG